ncbi:MAG: translation elongation factor 4 [Patescibacteria group bacterium]|nr:translation elongation factor 4 [Patescibacteria group bacterium]
MNKPNIRNFCVISHIDHGKTTLTDRFLEITNTVKPKDRKDRLLDSNPIERERGITIKLAPVRMKYQLNNQAYILNLIDTPGHVDFSYEVSRSLAACEGAILLVDATQGIQAQTMANMNKAIEANLKIIPVINKIDHPNAEIKKTLKEIKKTFGFSQNKILQISAKTGQGVLQLIKVVIEHLPSPKINTKAPLKALVFNSFYHSHKGVIAYVRLIAGQISKQDKLMLMSNQATFSPEEVGYFLPQMKPGTELFSGEVGYLATGLKDISLCRVGDTVTINPPDNKVKPFSGFIEPQPMVFMDLYPINSQDFIKLTKALEKLSLSDSSLSYIPVSSSVLGSGYKIGFQGLLHSDIIQERLEREFLLELIITSPSVKYKIILRKNNQEISILSPTNFPDPTLINQTKEPFIKLVIFVPAKYLGGVMNLCQNKRAKLQNQEFFGNQVKLIYNLPLQELISNFFGALKSVSSGFASLDWEFLEFKPAKIVKLQVLLNHQPIEPLSILIVKEKALSTAKKLASKLKEIIPRQQFETPIQIALGGKILARETIKAFRKDVTAKLYGGDPTRRQKLLSKQKKGKKRMKQIGKVNLPQEAFLSILQK